jgi:hypothetical protein
MNDPEKVRVVMDEFCEEMTSTMRCDEVCELCPLDTNNHDTIDRITEMFNNEL